MMIPCSYITSPNFNEPEIKLPSPSSVRIFTPFERFIVPGVKYSPNKFEGIEITPIVSLDPVGKYLLGFKVVER